MNKLPPIDALRLFSIFAEKFLIDIADSLMVFPVEMGQYLGANFMQMSTYLSIILFSSIFLSKLRIQRLFHINPLFYWVIVIIIFVYMILQHCSHLHGNLISLQSPVHFYWIFLLSQRIHSIKCHHENSAWIFRISQILPAFHFPR